MKLEPIPYKLVPESLKDSDLPQFNRATMEMYLKHDVMLANEIALINEKGLPLFAPHLLLNGKISSSWYGTDLVSLLNLPVPYSMLPELWAQASRITRHDDMMIGSGVVAHGTQEDVAKLGNVAWLSDEYIIDSKRGLDTYDTKKRYKLKENAALWDDRVMVVNITCGFDQIFDQIFGALVLYWKRIMDRPVAYEYALRQWVWAYCVMLTHRGKLMGVYEKGTGKLLAALCFYLQGDYLLFGAFSQNPHAKNMGGIGSYSLYRCAQLLAEQEDTRPIYLGTCSAELNNDNYYVYKKNCANKRIKIPCFATKGPNCSVSLQPPYYDVGTETWLS